MSKNEYHPGAVEDLARALIGQAVRDIVRDDGHRAEAEHFLRSDFVQLCGVAYDFDPQYLLDKATAPDTRKKWAEYERVKREKYTIGALCTKKGRKA